MSRLLRCAGLALSLLLAGLSRGNAACSLHVFGDLQVQPADDRALVKGAVNGHPVVFIVDTGAWISTMPRSDANRLGVRLDGLQLESEGIGGSVATTQGHMNLTLGDVHLPNEAMTVISSGSLDHDAVGLIGLDLLAQHDLEISLPEKNIRFMKSVDCVPGDLAYWIPDKSVGEVHLESDGEQRPAILFRVSLNGHEILAELDSGSPQTIVTLAGAQAANADLGEAKLVDNIGGIGAHKIGARFARFDTFSIGNETIRNAKIIVSDMWKYNRRSETGTHLGADTPEIFGPRMLLGADFLRAHRVLVANSMHVMAFSYVGGPVFDISAPQPLPPSSPPIGSPPQQTPTKAH